FVRKARTRAATLESSFDVFISATRGNYGKLRDLKSAFSSDGFLVTINDDIPENGGGIDQVQIALEASSHLVLLVDEKLSKSQDAELEIFLTATVKREFESRIGVHSRGLDATRRCAAVVELLAQVEHACGSCLMSPGLAASRVTWSRGCGL
ncbi:MAG TPA: hypothetical protein VEH31_27800, partial [Streptosporangiaceae bacterium]|nr:hypothetical protein [Streptosporangiaceae bacterium]